jgi:hypothetical protein
VAISVEIVAAPTDADAEITLAAGDGVRHVYFAVVNSALETNVYDGMAYTTEASAFYDAVEHRWLRVIARAEALQVVFQTSSDGDSWLDFQTFDASAFNFDDLVLWVAGGVFAGVVVNDDLAQFDNLRVCGTAG